VHPQLKLRYVAIELSYTRPKTFGKIDMDMPGSRDVLDSIFWNLLELDFAGY